MTTTQEIFDAVCERAKDKRRSVVFSGCVYRHPYDPTLKCFVGVLISDEEYDPKMEGLDVQALAEASLLPERLLPHVKLLLELQAVHDMYEPTEWDKQLQQIAKLFKLDAAALSH